MAVTDPIDLGVDSLDLEHRQIAALFNLLHDALEVPDIGTARELQATLTERLKVHFGREETLFVRHGYPNARTVAAEHRAAMNLIAEFGKALHHKTPEECRVILNELLYGFISCVYTDLACMQYFAKLGLDPVVLGEA